MDGHAGLEMMKPHFADPSTMPNCQRPNFVANPSAFFRRDEIENVQPAKILRLLEADEVPTGGIDIKHHAVEVGETNEVG